MDLTGTLWGWLCLAAFVVAYAMIVLEGRLQLRKSIPALISAALIWVVIAAAYAARGQSDRAVAAFEVQLLDYAELMLFLLAAMTFVNTIEERGVFEAVRARLSARGYSYRRLFWITGALAFVISPFADNLTTALIMGSVVLAMVESRPRFVSLACANVVVAANAGGAFSPFGDVTTLMIWQQGVVRFGRFFALFVPAVVSWLVPAAIMSAAVGPGTGSSSSEIVRIKPGGLGVSLLLALTIGGTVALHNWTGLPPVFGMMAGLGALKVYGYLLQRRLARRAGMAVVDATATDGDLVSDQQELAATPEVADSEPGGPPAAPRPTASHQGFDVFRQLERVEWDTLLFFYGVVLAVGGLATIGHLKIASRALYGALGPTLANTVVGLASALIDNVPITFAVLNMRPPLSDGQWLLVTLTTGIGGSLLSLGSAAGVALMGQARGVYTFASHLRWTWAIALGYGASIAVHLVVNRHLF